MGKFTDCFQKFLSLVCRTEGNVKVLDNKQTYKLSKVTVTRMIKRKIIKFPVHTKVFTFQNHC